MKSVLQNLGLMLVSTAIALAGIEVGLRVWGPDVLARGNEHLFSKFDPVLGWANLPGARGHYRNYEFGYPVAINANGMWDAELAPKRESEFRVAVLGDSFTWGIGAAYGERFTEVVEALDPAINVLNFGASGYSPIQYLLQLDDVLVLKPDYVVVAFCLGNDVTDNVTSTPYGRQKPFARLSSDGLRLEIAGYPLQATREFGPDLFGGGSALRIVGLVKRYRDSVERMRAPPQATGFAPSAVGPLPRQVASAQAGSVEPVYIGPVLYAQPGRLSAWHQQWVATLFRINELLLDAIRNKVEASVGPGRFAVLLGPTKFEYNVGRVIIPAGGDPAAVTERLRETLSRLGIPFIDGTPALGPPDFWKKDEHWRPTGHRKIGELLAGHLSKAAAQLPRLD